MPETLGEISHSNNTISEFIIVITKDYGKKSGADGDSDCLIGTKLQLNVRLAFDVLLLCRVTMVNRNTVYVSKYLNKEN